MPSGFEQASLEQLGEILCMAISLAGFILVGLWETFRPRSKLSHPLGRRWFNNIALYLVSLGLFTGVARIVATLAIAASVDTGISLTRLMERHPAAAFLAGFLLVDLIRYVSHWLHHRVPWLWRFHTVHHADPDVDVTTTFRHHPVEGLSMWVMTSAFYGLLDMPIAAVVAYEVVATTFASVQHANIRLPASLERFLLAGFVTPDMHRIHHSIEAREGDSNFGVVLSLWDKLFATYTALSHDEQNRLEMGLREYQRLGARSLRAILFAPFRISLGPSEP